MIVVFLVVVLGVFCSVGRGIVLLEHPALHWNAQLSKAVTTPLLQILMYSPFSRFASIQ
jgi:hypothetical protein